MQYRWNRYFADIATPTIRRFMDGQITEEELIERMVSHPPRRRNTRKQRRSQHRKLVKP